MTTLQAFLFGMMAAWMSCLFIVVWLLRDSPLASEDDADKIQQGPG
jgi:hypothetical protein